jgi:hypothetical protein
VSDHVTSLDTTPMSVGAGPVGSGLTCRVLVGRIVRNPRPLGVPHGEFTSHLDPVPASQTVTQTLGG